MLCCVSGLASLGTPVEGAITRGVALHLDLDSFPTVFMRGQLWRVDPKLTRPLAAKPVLHLSLLAADLAKTSIAAASALMMLDTRRNPC